jgi:hypothetical protein
METEFSTFKVSDDDVLDTSQFIKATVTWLPLKKDGLDYYEPDDILKIIRSRNAERYFDNLLNSLISKKSSTDDLLRDERVPGRVVDATIVKEFHQELLAFIRTKNNDERTVYCTLV